MFIRGTVMMMGHICYVYTRNSDDDDEAYMLCLYEEQ